LKREGGGVAKADVDTVDVYLARLPADVQRVLERVRRIIRRALPRAEETISYQIPSYRLQSRYVVYFAGWKKHWSLYPVTEPVRVALGPELARYEVSKGTVRFPWSDPVPARLVGRIVRELAKAAEGRARDKSARQHGARISRTSGRRR
jgi:uncharacterized protein YdhG (YjbR/CyaY superfamily)